MPTILIKHGDIILKDRILKDASLLLRGHKIASVGGAVNTKPDIVIDAAGCYVSPGLIDTHIHGDPAAILPYEIKHGTTSVVIAESCAPLAEIFKKSLRMMSFMKHDPLGGSILGFRMEGPYINKKKAGAQDRRYIKKPDKKELEMIIKRCSPALKMMTIAPELKGASALIKLLEKKGILPSVGHSYATSRETERGVSAGIAHATHVFNAMRPTAKSDSGVVGAVMSDARIWAEIILDLIHVHPSLFILLLQAKGPDRVILITDSVRADHQKGVKRARGAYRFRDGRLAGSALTMIQAVRNTVACGLAIPAAVKLASYNPAKMLGIHSRKGVIGRGKDADIIIFDKNFNVKMTIVRGRIIFRKKGF